MSARWMRYPRLWLRLLALCAAHEPRLTLAAAGCRLLGLATLPATALALRAAVDAGARAHAGAGAIRAAVFTAIGVAVAYTVNHAAEDMSWGYAMELADRVGLLELEIEILRDICEVRTTDHLERADFLDRVTLLRDAAWRLVFSAWDAADTVAHLVRLSVVLALLGAVSPYLMLLLVFAAIPLWFDGRGRRATRAAEIATAEQVRLQRHLFELATTPGPAKDVRVNGAGPELTRRQEQVWDAVYERGYQARVVAALWQTCGWAVFTTGFAAALALVVYRAARDQSTLGDVVLSVTVATSLRDAVHQAVGRSAETAMGARLIEPYLWLEDFLAARKAEPRGSQPAPTVLRHGITLKDVSYRYPGTGTDALDRVSVHLPAGRLIALVGEYGSGKSTLVKLLCKFHSPTGGAILVDGVDLADVDATCWWAGTAVAFQDFGRYRTAFRDVVGIGDLPSIMDDRRIGAALAAADATSLVDRLPDGVDSLLGRDIGGVEPSEGQWQKTALARACMRTEPRLFVLDEPTASLDAPSEQAIYQRYLARARHLAMRMGAITVVVSHRLSTVAGADLILVLREGRLVQAGTHDELLSDAGLYAELHALSSRAYETAPLGRATGAPQSPPEQR